MAMSRRVRENFRSLHILVSNGELEIKTLNTDLVDKDLQDTASIKQAFLKNKDNKDLFTNPGKFRRVKVKS